MKNIKYKLISYISVLVLFCVILPIVSYAGLDAIETKDINKKMIIQQVDEFIKYLSRMKMREVGSTEDLNVKDYLVTNIEGENENRFPLLNMDEIIDLFTKGVVKIKRDNVLRGKVFELKLGDKEYGNVYITKYTDNSGERVNDFYLKIMGKIVAMRMMAHRIWSTHPTAPFSSDSDVISDIERITKIKEWLNLFISEEDENFILKNTIINYFYNDSKLLNGSPFFMGVDSVRGEIKSDWWRYDLMNPGSLTGYKTTPLTLKEDQLWSSRNAEGFISGLSKDNISLNAQDKFDLPTFLMNGNPFASIKTNLSFEAYNKGRTYKLLSYVDEDDIIPENRGTYLVEIILNDKSISTYLGQKIERMQSDALAEGINGVDAGFLVSKQIIYRTHIKLVGVGTPQTEDDLEMAWPKVLDIAKNIPIPHIAEYDKFNSGDQIVSRVVGEIKGQFILSAYLGKMLKPLKGFIQGCLKGEFDLGMRKLPNNRVEVSIQPQVVTQAGGNFDIFRYIGMNAESSMSILRKQIIQFNLNYKTFDGTSEDYPALRAFLKLALWGEIPYKELLKFETIKLAKFKSYGGPKNSFVTPNKILLHVNNKNRELIPKGMRISYMENVDIGYVHLQSKMLLPIASIGKAFMPTRSGGKILNFRFNQGFFHRIITNGQVATSERSYGKKVENQGNLMDGLGENVSATIHGYHGRDTEDGNLSTVDSIMLEAVMDAPIISSSDEERLIKELNDKFPGLWLDLKRVGKDSHPRRIHLSMKVTSEDFKYLEKYGYNEIKEAISRIVVGSEKGSAERIIEKLTTKLLGGKHEIDFATSIVGRNLSRLGIAASSFQKMSAYRIDEFLKSIGNLGTTRQKAKNLAELIKDYGIDAFSMVYILMGSPEDKLVMRTESNYFQLSKEVDSLIDFYTDYTVNSKTGYKYDHNSKIVDVEEMFAWGMELRREIIKSLVRVYYDPFLLDSGDNALKSHLDHHPERYQYIVDNNIREFRDIKVNQLLLSLEKLETFYKFKKLSDHEKRILYTKAQNGKSNFGYVSDALPFGIQEWREQVSGYYNDVVDFSRLSTKKLKLKRKKVVDIDVEHRLTILKDKYKDPVSFDLSHDAIESLVMRLLDINDFLYSMKEEENDLYKDLKDKINRFNGDDENERQFLIDKQKTIEAFAAIAPKYKRKRIGMFIEYKDEATKLILPAIENFGVEGESSYLFKTKLIELRNRLKARRDIEQSVGKMFPLMNGKKGRVAVAYELFNNAIESKYALIDKEMVK